MATKDLDEIKTILTVSAKEAAHRPSVKGAVQARINEEKHIAETWNWDKIYKLMSAAQITVLKCDTEVSQLEVEFQTKKKSMRRQVQRSIDTVNKCKRIMKWKKQFMQMKK